LRYWYKSTNTDAEGKDLKECGMEEVRQGGRGTAAANEANEAPKEPPAETKEKAQAAAATDKAAAEKAAAEQAAAAKAAADAKVLLRENTRLCACVCVIPVCVCVCVCRKSRC
jgi:hypothetical protein